jgi:hypothetical protein
MAKKRIHEIAKAQGLTSKELLAGLKAAGVEAKSAQSSVEESVALAALNLTEARPKATAAEDALPYAKAQRPRNKKKWWVFSGLILIVIAVAAVASGGSDNSSSTASDSGAANSAASGNEATPKESKPESTPASSGPTDELPLRDGDWRLDSISVHRNGYGDFWGTARITYTGENPEGEDNIFTVTLFKGGKDVAVLQGAANAITREDTATVQLPSSDPWVGGPYTYDFRAEL